MIYDYESEIKAVTQEPTTHESNFLLRGQLILMSDANSTLVRLADLKYKLYNGAEEESYREESVEIPLVKELENIQQPFRVIYDKSGNTIAIAMTNEDKQYVRNIKRAIASMLQLDVENVDLNSKMPHAFVNEERSIYGTNTVYYNVLPQEETMVVQKMRNVSSVMNAPNSFLFKNVRPMMCADIKEEPFSRDSQVVYRIAKRDGQQVVERIESTGGIYAQPFEGKGEAFYVYVQQTLNLREMKAQTALPEIQNQRYEEDISYQTFEPMGDKSDAVSDMTLGRRFFKGSDLVPEATIMLDEMAAYLKENQIKDQQPNIKNGQLINRIMRVLITMEMPALETLFKSMMGKQPHEEIVQQLLPLIGSKASVEYIMSLVKENKLEETVLVNMLTTMPLNVKIPTFDFLHLMKPLLNMGNEVSMTLRKPAVLAFATMMHMIEKHTCHCARPAEVRSQEEKARVEKVMEELESYVVMLVKKLKAATTYEEQIMYLSALYNTKLDSIVEHLMPAVRGEWWNNRHLRALAMWAVHPMAIRDADVTFGLFWPILSDSRLHTELRIVAYYILMESSPSLGRMINISWLMNSETNHEMYQFHYRYLTTLAKTTDPCKEEFRIRVNQILKYTYVPNMYGMTGYYQMDYVDPEYNFGGIVNTVMISTEKSISFRVRLDYHLMGKKINEQSLMIKIHGIDGLNKLMLSTKAKQLLDYAEMMKVLKEQIPNNKDVHLEMYNIKQGQVMDIIHISGDQITDLKPVLERLWQPINTPVKNYININYVVYGLLILPTDIGFPAMIKNKMPMLHQVERNLVTSFVNNIYNLKIDNRYKIWAHSYTGVSFYNPIADVYQGIGKYRSVDIAYPLRLEMSFNVPQQTLKITWLRNQKQNETTGMRVHTTSMVYVKDDLHNGALKQSSPKSESFVVVSRGPEYRKEAPVTGCDLDNLGIKYDVKIFDSERHVTNESLHNFVAKRWSRYNKNYETPLQRLFLTWWNLNAYIMLQPAAGTHGVLRSFVQTPDSPVTSNELTVRLTRDVKFEDSVLMPAMKWNAKVAYAVKSGDKPIKTWDMNTIVDLPSGHNSVNVKAQLTRTITGQKELRMCLEGNKVWTDEGVTGKWMLGLNQDADAKCTKEDAILEIDVKGEKSEEQKRYPTYAACKEAGITNHTLHQFVPCYHAQSSIRHYTYDVKCKDMPEDFRKGMYRWMSTARNIFSSSHVSVEEPTEQMQEHRARVQVTYPSHDEHVHIDVHTPDHKYVVYGAPELKYFGLLPGNTQFSKMYLMYHNMGLMRHCVVRENSIQMRNDIRDYDVPQDWTLLIGDAAQNAENAVYVKQVEGDRLVSALQINFNSFLLTNYLNV